MSYNLTKKFFFNKNESFPLSGDEVITMPHPILQFTVLTINKKNKDLLSITSSGLEEIFQPTSPFITAPFLDIFFRGIHINCIPKSITANVICSKFMSGIVSGSFKINETSFGFGLFKGVSFFFTFFY